MRQPRNLRRYVRQVAAVAGVGLVASVLAVAGASADLPNRVVNQGAPEVADAFNGLVAAPDGGTYSVGYQVVGGTNRAVLVTKNNADGSIDTSFGTNGRAVIDLVGTFHETVTTNPGAKETAKGVAVDRLGRLIVVGELEGIQSSAASAVDTDVFVARLHPNGALDRSYGTDGGWSRLSFSDGVNPAGGPAIADAAGWDVFVRDNQRAILSVAMGTDSAGTRTGRDAAAVQLKANGQLDTGFGEDGIATIPTPFSDNLRRGMLDDDGSYFTTSYANVGANNQPFVQKFTPDGEPDETWGDGGLSTVYPGGRGGFAEAYGITTGLDGNYLVSAYGYRGGRTGAEASNSVDALLFSLTSTGSLDTTWGDRGLVSYHIGENGNNSGDRHRDHLTLPDGRVVGVGGTSGTSDALVTLTNADGSPGETQVIDFGGTDDYLWGITSVGDGYQVVAAGYGNGDSQLVLLDLSPAASTTSLTLADAEAAYGAANSATITVAAEGGPVAGSVDLTVDGTPMSTVEVDESGTATVDLPSDLTVGSHELVATLAPASGVAGSRASATLTIVKASSATSVRLAKSKVKASQRALATVTVRAGLPPGITPTGTITVRDGAKRIATAKVAATGVTKIRLPKLSVKRHQLRFSYSGDTYVGASTGRATLTVVK